MNKPFKNRGLTPVLTRFARRGTEPCRKRFDFAPTRLLVWLPACSSAEYPYSRPRARLGLGRARPFPYSPTYRSKPMTQIAEHTSSVEMATPSEPAAVPALEVHDLRKEFIRRDGGKRKGWRRKRRRVAALKGVSFTMERGETVAILGQNGSGKSTLVRLLSTLLLHEGGSASDLRSRRLQGHARGREARQPGLGRGLLLQEDVRRREPELRRALLRDARKGRRRTRSRRS